MIKREYIEIKVKEILEKNKLEKSFWPIVEEFFYRAADQYEWDDYDLRTAINRFEKVYNIRFTKFKDKGTSGRISYYLIRNSRNVLFSLKHLKGILKFEELSIDGFINDAMHELGHVIQSNMKYGYIYKSFNDTLNTGFAKMIHDGENKSYINSNGRIANEYAEIINATRLQNGNIKEGKYKGYTCIQDAARVMINSLGISEMEYSDLQLKGRKDYEDFVANKLGRLSKQYIDDFEEILDNIWNYNCNGEYTKILEQINLLQTISKDLFEERLTIGLKSEDCLGNLAKIIVDKEQKDLALIDLFHEFKINPKELKLDTGINIYQRLQELGYKDGFLSRLEEVVLEEREQRKEQNNKQNEKKYNNEELREKIYQSFLNYPTKDMSFTDRVSIAVCKAIGKHKRRSLNKDTNNLLVECNNSSDAKKQFAFRMSDLEQYNIETAKSIQNINLMKSRTYGNNEIGRDEK